MKIKKYHEKICVKQIFYFLSKSVFGRILIFRMGSQVRKHLKTRISEKFHPP